MNFNPLLLIDFYKATHSEQYPKDVAKIVSYYTPRMSRLKDDDSVVFFGLQGFVRDYLMDGFQQNFFGRPKEQVVAEYKRILDYTLGAESYKIEKIEKLHDLGYLPIEIKSLSEGVDWKIGLPLFEISNTHPDFAWVTNTLESAISCSLWHTMQSANVARRYRLLTDPYVLKTCDLDLRRKVLGDFSFRGQESIESGIKSSSAWLLGYDNTATVPAIMWLEKNYKCNVETEVVGKGAISTEHSVMCSNFSVDGDEITHLKRLLTEIYPNQSFSMVSDSYDYWNMVDNIIPQCKDEILAHNGYFGCRGDSGDIVEVVTRTVFKFWETFGGTVNKKGYKVLDPHVKVIYGDSVTPEKCERIYSILEARGFAVSNVILGVGSFSFQCLQQDGKFQPYTRDTYGVAIKATYAELKDGTQVHIYKNPKESTFKKSQKGCCIVHEDGAGGYSCSDGYSFEDTKKDFNLLKTLWKDGKFINEGYFSLIKEKFNLCIDCELE